MKSPLWLLERMLLIRRFEEVIVGLSPTDVMVTPVESTIVFGDRR